MNQTTTYFCRRLRGLFNITGYRREELARHIGVPVQTVRQWESGAKAPNVYQFREIAAFFDLPYGWFLDGADGLPEAPALALRLGLSEDTVNLLMELAECAPEGVQDTLDDAVYALLDAVRTAGEVGE